ncbi:MAG: hypothetical protein MPF33_10890 [Candidatus Aramenus sp.]|jgi:hypothetical protein|nr:hypothetical protein [Candidatus Aramenus sp.]
MVKLIAKYKAQGKTYSFTLEGEESKTYEDLEHLLQIICEKIDVEEYSVSEVLNVLSFGKIVTTLALSSLLLPSDFKASYDQTMDTAVKTILGT